MAKIDKSDVDKYLFLASCNQHMELVEELLKKGGEVNYKYEGDRNSLTHRWSEVGDDQVWRGFQQADT